MGRRSNGTATRTRARTITGGAAALALVAGSFGTIALEAPAAGAKGQSHDSTASGPVNQQLPKGVRKAPSGLGFYKAPTPLPPGEPGDIIWAAPYQAVPGAKAWKVLYHSRSLAGDDIAVSGVIVVPDGKAPAGGRPVISWAHGTHGIADNCAPSRVNDWVPRMPAIKSLVEQGYVVAATDYEGLGTPGTHPYLVGESEARGTLDVVRAARNLPGSDASAQTVVWGHSQGGQASLFAGEIAPTYAPELDLRGIVAGAPVTDVAAMFPAASTIPATLGFVVMGLQGIQAAFPDADAQDVLTPQAIAKADKIVNSKCYEDVLAAFNQPVSEVIGANPADVAPFPELFARDTTGNVATAAPQFVYQGKSDDVVYKVFTDAYVKKVCGMGNTVEYTTFGGKDHYEENDAAEAQILDWIRGRLAGDAAPSSCATLPS
ncbi:MAG: lipase family protein [Acidimicrobiia bacterium]